MIARSTGACLGLLAFVVTTVAGLAVRNPVSVTLSRSIFALLGFCLMGFVLGSVAQLVVAEHVRKRESQIRDKYRVTPVSRDGGGAEDGSNGDNQEPAS